MGASWRIGLDDERMALVAEGLFRWSRNPTFLGMVTLVTGAVLVVPAVLAAAWVAFSIQIRMEEEHLTRMHGAAYAAYSAAVPRWIGLARQRPAVATGEVTTPPSDAQADPVSPSRFT
jgi:protein-S-isoprenylcysteine O-methyltransferase Ste14